MKKCFFIILSFLFSTVVNAQEKKWNHILEGGIITYGPGTKDLGFSFRTIHGYKVYPNLKVGAGSGFEKFILDNDDDHKLVPIFLQAKYDLASSKKSNFFGAFDIGYAVNLGKEKKSTFEKSDYDGGILLSPQLGLKRNFKNAKQGMYLLLGYKIQHVEKQSAYKYRHQLFNSSTNNDEYDSYETKRYNLQRLSVMIGFEF